MSSFDWYLDRVVHFERPDTLTVDHDIERATTDLHSDRFVRQLESCRHLQSPFCVSRSAGPLNCVTRHLSGAVPRGSPSCRVGGMVFGPDFGLVRTLPSVPELLIWADNAPVANRALPRADRRYGTPLPGKYLRPLSTPGVRPDRRSVASRSAFFRAGRSPEVGRANELELLPIARRQSPTMWRPLAPSFVLRCSIRRSS